MKVMMVPLEKLTRLNEIERLARAYVQEEMADDPALVKEGATLHELAKALGLVEGEKHEHT